MNAFLILAVTIGVVSADVSSLGYQYNVPQTSYGVPSHQIGSASSNTFSYKGQSQSGYQGLGGGQGVVSYPTGSVGAVYQGLGGAAYQSGSGSGYQSASSGSGYQSGSGSGFQSGSGLQSASLGSGYQSGSSGFQSGSGYQFGGSGLQSGSVGQGFQSGGSGGSLQSYQTSNQYQSQYEQKYQQQVQYQQQPAQVFKHFYVHAAPEEQEYAKPRNPVVLPPAQKHYKIIFIKTPAPSISAAQVAPIVPQNEEKTIVYVLVKKPEDIQDVVVPKIEQKPPSKPEVYFIKYKNKDDSQAVINNIVNDYSKGQQSVSFSGLGTDAGSSGSSGFSGASGLSGSSGFSGLSGSSGFVTAGQQSSGSGFSGSSGLSAGSLGSGHSVDSGSYSGHYDSGNAASTVGPSYVVSSTESGLGGVGFGQSSGSQGAASFSSSGYSQGSSLAGVTISKSEPVSTAVTTGYESGDLGSSVVGLSHGVVGSSTVNYDVNAISSSQGVPHETYGVPAFKPQ